MFKSSSRLGKTHSLTCCEHGMGGLEGHIDLPALQSLPCLSKSCLGRGGHEHLVYQYTVTGFRCIVPVPCCAVQ